MDLPRRFRRPARTAHSRVVGQQRLAIWSAEALVNQLHGSFIDGYQLSRVTLRDLGIEGQSVITLRLGVKEDAHNVGGINLFGSTFGNYPQDITLRIEQMRSSQPSRRMPISSVVAGAPGRR